MILTLSFPTSLLSSPEYQEYAEALQEAPSLAEMVCIVMQMGLLFARRLLENELLRRGKEEVEWPNCESCGHRLHSKGWQSRQMQTLVGKIY